MTNILDDLDELLYRHIHPSLLMDNEPVSGCFYPNRTDNGKLSVDRSSLVTPEQSFQTYTKTNKSSAIYALSVKDFKESNISCISDPLENNAAHALADYSVYVGCSNSQRTKIAKLLRKKSVDKGCVFSLSDQDYEKTQDLKISSGS
jgi:hypothetical protein